MPRQKHDCNDLQSISKTEENPISEFVELSVRLAPCSNVEDAIEVRAELRLKPDDFDDGDILFEVGAKKVSIVFKLEGLSIIPGTRFREPYVGGLQNQKIVTESEASISRSVNATLTGGVKASSKVGVAGEAASSAGFQRDNTQKQTQKKTSSEEHEISAVSARGSNTWQIFEDGRTSLNGTYLRDQDVLFSMRKNKGGNRQAMRAIALIKHRDLNFSFPHKSLKNLTVTDKKLLSIFVAKCIAGEDYFGRVVASSVKVEFE